MIRIIPYLFYYFLDCAHCQLSWIIFWYSESVAEFVFFRAFDWLKWTVIEKLILGCLETREGKCEDSSGNQGVTGFVVWSEQRASWRSTHHGIRWPSVLRSYHCHMHDCSDDARYSTHAARLFARLHSKESAEHWIKSLS